MARHLCIPILGRDKVPNSVLYKESPESRASYSALGEGGYEGQRVQELELGHYEVQPKDYQGQDKKSLGPLPH